MNNVVTKKNMGLFPNNCTNYLAPHLIFALNLYNDIFASTWHVIMWLSIAPCVLEIYVFFAFPFWVSIDSGVEVNATYPNEQYYTPRQQGKS